jgi:transposase-like protein
MKPTFGLLAAGPIYTERLIRPGSSIDFLLSPNRDLTAAKGLLQLALSAVPVRPRVINVDGHRHTQQRSPS